MAILAPNAFANGRGVGLGRADALWKGGDAWQVWLYPTDRPIKQYHIEADDASKAISEAWKKLKAET